MAIAAIFGAALFVALSGAAMPGPLLMVTVGRVAARGFAVAPRIVLGHALLELGMVLALFWGLQPVLQRPGLQGAVGLVGGAALLWMGLGALGAVRRGQVQLELQASSPLLRGGAVHDLTLGVTASASNPYWLMWWATIGAKLSLDALRLGLPGLLAFYLGHVAGDLAWYGSVGGLVACGCRSINDRVYRAFLVTCAVALMALGIGCGLAGARLVAAPRDRASASNRPPALPTRRKSPSGAERNPGSSLTRPMARRPADALREGARARAGAASRRHRGQPGERADPPPVA